jgi:glycosyltransferase involved in cell wall biosynthesis
LRIAVINWSRRKVGGAEAYLGLTLSALSDAGHEVAFWYETDKPANREPIPLNAGVPTWSIDELGAERALEALRRWQPDLIYSHGLLNPEVETETLRIAPAVFSAHGYYGTCISGEKTFKNPTVTPCQRRFGWQCLLSYYPRRCGGLNPVTMLKLYGVQSRRLSLLREYRAVLTHSFHMREEYIKHGLPAERVHALSYYVQSGVKKSQLFPQTPAFDAPPHIFLDSRVAPRPLHEDRYHILFTGRIDRLKGGRTLLEALPRVAVRLNRPLQVTFAGDGPDRAAWERRAKRVQRRVDAIQINFTGWASRDELNSLLAASDLLVFPSQWPEPFGLVGPEAGFYGVPVAAFAVGGISDWLIDGVNGHLAPGHPPTADGLADAIVKCLADPATHARLSRGALDLAQRFSMKNHLTALVEIFESVLRQKPEPSLTREPRLASVAGAERYGK